MTFLSATRQTSSSCPSSVLGSPISSGFVLPTVALLLLPYLYWTPYLILQIWHNNAGLMAAWHLDFVELEHTGTGAVYRFECGQWLSETSDNELVRELPATGALIKTPATVTSFLGSSISFSLHTHTHSLSLLPCDFAAAFILYLTHLMTDGQMATQTPTPASSMESGSPISLWRSNVSQSRCWPPRATPAPSGGCTSRPAGWRPCGFRTQPQGWSRT